MPTPPVSVVVPVLNEERHLADAVARILEQDYPGELEVVLALGPSHPDFAVVRSRVAAAVGAAEADDAARATAGAARPGGAASGDASSSGHSPAATGGGQTRRSPSAPGTDTAASGTDVCSA